MWVGCVIPEPAPGRMVEIATDVEATAARVGSASWLLEPPPVTRVALSERTRRRRGRLPHIIAALTDHMRLDHRPPSPTRH